MNSDRVTWQGKASPESEGVVDALQATVRGADLSSLERARILVASKFSEEERAHESMNRGTEAAELLGKLRMDAETLAVALLLPLVDEGALDPTAIKKWVGVEAARLTQGALRIASLKDLRKTATETLQAHRRAHWQYKEGLQRRIAWSRGFLESGERTPRGIDLIERFKQAAFHDRIYVLTPRGHIIDLPADATPLDFAYAVHTEVGHRCRGAKVDGLMVPLTKTLASGQQVEILTARDGHPSRDWLNPNLGYLKTASARAKVRRWLKQQDHEAHVAQGRAVLEREHRRLGLGEINIAELAKRFKMRRAEDLLAALGCGDISTVRLGYALGTQVPPQAPSTAASSPPTPPRAGLLVHGASNVLTKVAGCCRPVPGEPIGGYVTAQGGGISIHRRDCPNLKQLAALRPHKLVEVAWGEEKGIRADP
jgi:(p)ppGpp synthase/HD superfamily hydrolase